MLVLEADKDRSIRDAPKRTYDRVEGLRIGKTERIRENQSLQMSREDGQNLRRIKHEKTHWLSFAYCVDDRLINPFLFLWIESKHSQYDSQRASRRF